MFILSINIKVNMRRLPVYNVTQGAIWSSVYEGVSISFRTGRLQRDVQMVQFSATRCSCIAIL
jgi:hypothetical protein